MIKEAKNFIRDLTAAITPASLATNNATPLEVSGNYDWNAQAYSYDVCNFGTTHWTSVGTNTNGPYGGFDVDTNNDSISD